MWLYSPVCVGHGRKTRRPVFSQRGSYSSYILIMLHVIKHNFSKEGFSDLLLLMNSHLPKPSLFTTSTYKFKETMEMCISSLKDVSKHTYCGNCHTLLMEENPCSNEHCLTIREQRKKNFTTCTGKIN